MRSINVPLDFGGHARTDDADLVRFGFSPNNYDQAPSDGSNRYEAFLDFRMFRIENLKVIAGPEPFRDFFESRCSLRTWVYRVAHNTAASYVLRQKKARREAMVSTEAIKAVAEPAGSRLEVEHRLDRDRFSH